MDDKVREFLENHHGAIQTTLRKDGSPHVARIGVGLVDGKLWSSATQTRLRTKHLRRDPRSTLAVLNYEDTYTWLGLDCVVTILDGPDAVDQNLALYRVIAGKDPDDMAEYRAAMVKDQRLIYEFEIKKAYGLY
jgi:PPOX class probable F420-dependent enzyme